MLSGRAITLIIRRRPFLRRALNDLMEHDADRDVNVVGQAGTTPLRNGKVRGDVETGGKRPWRWTKHFRGTPVVEHAKQRHSRNRFANVLKSSQTLQIITHSSWGQTLTKHIGKKLPNLRTMVAHNQTRSHRLHVHGGSS